MLKHIKGIKGYQDNWRKRLPNTNLRGLWHDINLHINITPSDARHIFILGAPRSGTTLIRGLVAAHSNVTTTDEETYFFCRRRTSLFSCPEAPEVTEYIAKASSKVEAFDQIAYYFRRRDHVKFFLEKTPEHALVLDNLLQWYPNSRFVFVLRDGRDAYSSSFRNPGFHARSGKSYPTLWRDIMRIFLRNRDDERVVPVFYEELVCRPAVSLRDLMGALELSYEENQMDQNIYGGTSLAKHVGHEKLNGPVDTTSIGAFRHRLSSKQIKKFELVAGTELRALGYLS